nr:Arl16 [Vischeria sp. CAUP Q 202]
MKRPLLPIYGSRAPDSVELKVLVVGCSGVGKTLLLRHLKQRFMGLTEPEKGSSGAGPMHMLKVDTQPTTGTDVQTITYQEVALTFREVGSALMTRWSSYYGEADIIMYVIDSANMVQIPSSWIELLNLLNHKEMQEKAVLIVMNKSDISDQSSVATLKSIMRMDDILGKAQAIRTGVVNVSALTGMNFDALLKTILKFGGEIKNDKDVPATK